MAPILKSIKNKQCAVLIGTPIAILNVPTIKFQKIAVGEYEATLKFRFKPDVENNSSNPNEEVDLPGSSDFAVLKLSEEKITPTKIKIEFGYKTIGLNDYEIDIDVDSTIPGNKGNHQG